MRGLDSAVSKMLASLLLPHVCLHHPWEEASDVWFTLHICQTSSGCSLQHFQKVHPSHGGGGCWKPDAGPHRQEQAVGEDLGVTPGKREPGEGHPQILEASVCRGRAPREVGGEVGEGWQQPREAAAAGCPLWPGKVLLPVVFSPATGLWSDIPSASPLP